jgi:hypothetical protein
MCVSVKQKVLGMTKVEWEKALFNACKIRDWLKAIWPAYLINDDRVRITESSANWKSEGKMRASSAFDCAKKHAAERLNLPESEKEPIPVTLAIKFDDGMRRGESVAEAIEWGVRKENDRYLHFKMPFKWEAAFEDRQNAEEFDFAGTPDIVLRRVFENKDTETYPVEVKRTGVMRNGGVSWTQMLQTIVYMNLLHSSFGFIYTTYPLNDTDPDQVTHKVWIVAETFEEDGWWLIDEKNKPIQVAGDDFPTTWNGTVYYPRGDFNELVQEHKDWYQKLKDDPEAVRRVNGPAKKGIPTDWRCGKTVLPEYYKRKSGQYEKGDLKPHTGTIYVRCPLFKYCYEEELRRAGFDPSNIPNVLNLEGDKIKHETT